MTEQKENKFTPKLRFPDFNSQWKLYKLDDIASFSKGKNISKNDIVSDGAIECIRYGELYTDYNEIIKSIKSRTNIDVSELILSESNDVIIPSSGETQLDIATASCVLKEGVALGGDLNIIKTKEDGVFLSFYLNNKKKKMIASLAQGNSVVHLYNKQLKTLNLVLPELEEQQKIASFLTSVDDKINQLKEKKALLEQYKKGVMQKIFKQELRFKDENGNPYPDWEEKKLGDISNINKGVQLNAEFLTKEGKYPCINGGVNESGYTEKFNRKKNSITVSEGGNSCGYVNFLETDFWCGGHCYTVDIFDKKITTTFLYQMLKYNERLIMRLRVGSGLPNIQKKDLINFKINYPSDNLEQEKITSFLNSTDKKVQQVILQIDNTELFKKGLLQQMFV